jgi:NAD+ kinase
VSLAGPPRRVGVVAHPERDVTPAVAAAAGWARRRGAELVLSDEAARHVRVNGLSSLPPEQLAERSDLLLAAGGDGTVLRALRLAAPRGVPVLGVNFGRLGYLSELDADELDEGLDAVARGDFEIERHVALRLGLPGSRAVAFNDVVVSRPRGEPQALIDLTIDGELVTRHDGDGLIVATAPGSTAYSFSAGGPILSPRLDALIVTPLAPHATFNRSLVLSPEERARLDVAPDGPALAVEVDGRELPDPLAPGAALKVEAEPGAASVVRLGRVGFGARAREKL